MIKQILLYIFILYYISYPSKLRPISLTTLVRSLVLSLSPVLHRGWLIHYIFLLVMKFDVMSMWFDCAKIVENRQQKRVYMYNF